MPPTNATKDLVDLKTVIGKVQEALDEYQSGLGGGAGSLPPLASAEFDFKTTTDVAIGATVSFWIIKLGVTKTKESVNELTFTYEPPKPPKPPKTALTAHVNKPPVEMKDALAKAIKSAAQAVQNSDTGKLKFTKLSVTVQFGVKWDGNGGIGIPISLVTIGPNVDISKNSVHSVKVVFGKAEG